ncbi:hypothetical protein E2C01_093614 [Portunus trituberculatus]|uniref:Uncharacterized protein n=1 Tax=Portunus trituberculatus TaxID=210409 RepID=A0A5B7K0Y0_PORTR|nr:hypothetical protein [Portunus trituberculatus]
MGRYRAMQFANEGVVRGSSPLSRRNDRIIISRRGGSATLGATPPRSLPRYAR